MRVSKLAIWCSIACAGSATVALAGDAAVKPKKVVWRAGRTIPLGQNIISGIALSRDGRKVAVAWAWDPVEVRDVATGNLLLSRKRSPRYGGTISGVAFSPDGAELAMGGCGADDLIEVATVATASTVRALAGSLGADTPVWSRAGDRIAAACYPDTGPPDLRAWDAATGALLARSPVIPTGLIDSIALSPDATMVAVTSRDVFQLWTLATGDVRTIAVPAARPEFRSACAVAFTPDGKMVAAGCADGSVRFWDVGTLALVRTLPRAFEPVAAHHDLSFLDGGAFVCISPAGVAVRNATTGKVSSRVPRGATYFAATPDGKRIATVSDDLTIWNRRLVP